MVEMSAAGTVNHETFAALGTTAHVATAGNLAETVRITKSVLERVDAARSRFRNDSDLSRLNACAGSFVQIGPDLAEALAVAIDAARVTGGAVDPTIGNSLINLGYDRTFEDISQSSGFDGVCCPAAGWEAIEVRNNGSEVRVPVGVRLDLGATAKALAADKCAQLAASAIGLGVLVSIGGDIAVSGTAPERGWVVGIADSHRTAFAESDEAVVFSAGGLATSSTTVRRWRSGEAALHHIVDPTTGGPAPVVWKTVSVVAASCVAANTASTAAIVFGLRAEAWLSGLGCAARLKGANGEVIRLNGWPASSFTRVGSSLVLD